MKYSFTQTIPIFNRGEVLQDLVKGEDGKDKKTPVTLGKMLGMVCANAQVDTFDEKYRVYKIASRVNDAEKEGAKFELSPEDVVLIKKLAGKGPYTAIAAGALLDVLEDKRDEQRADQSPSP